MKAPITSALLVAALGLGLGLPATAQQALASPEYCGLLSRCGLTVPPGRCSAELSAGVPEVTYDALRCREARDLSVLGFPPTADDATRIYSFLGHPRRISYAVEDRVPLSEARLGYLITDIPFAARLLTHFQGTRYEAHYLDEADHRRFHASREGTLETDATWIAGEMVDSRLYYFGTGRSIVGPWSVKGRALVQADFADQPDGRLWYRINILVAPNSDLLDRIMNLDLFRKIVIDEVRSVLDDMTAAAHALQQRGLGEGDWTDEERRKVAAFLALP